MLAPKKTKFRKAFQDPEFCKMMSEYVDEISDPKHRAEQDAYIRQMEAEGDVPEDLWTLATYKELLFLDQHEVGGLDAE